jgi:hypothetical protein
MCKVRHKVCVEGKSNGLRVLVIKCGYYALHNGNRLNRGEEELVESVLGHIERIEHGSKDMSRDNSCRPNLWAVISVTIISATSKGS